MNFDQLKQLSEQGKLILEKHYWMTNTRRIPIYSKTEGEWLCGKFFGNEIGHKEIQVRLHRYLARTSDMPENAYWRITSKDYKKLSTAKGLTDL